jgi:hypothetical protein
LGRRPEDVLSQKTGLRVEVTTLCGHPFGNRPRESGRGRVKLNNFGTLSLRGDFVVVYGLGTAVF